MSNEHFVNRDVYLMSGEGMQDEEIDAFVNSTLMPALGELAARQGVDIENDEYVNAPEDFTTSSSFETDKVMNSYDFGAFFDSDTGGYLFRISNIQSKDCVIEHLPKAKQEFIMDRSDLIELDLDERPESITEAVTVSYEIHEADLIFTKKVETILSVEDEELDRISLGLHADEAVSVDVTDQSADKALLDIHTEMKIMAITEEDLANIRTYLFYMGLTGGELVEEVPLPAEFAHMSLEEF